MKLFFKGLPHLQEYRGGDVCVKAGDQVEVSDEKGEQLLADFPGVFFQIKTMTLQVENVEAIHAADMEEPPEHKQVKRTIKRK